MVRFRHLPFVLLVPFGRSAVTQANNPPIADTPAAVRIAFGRPL